MACRVGGRGRLSKKVVGRERHRAARGRENHLPLPGRQPYPAAPFMIDVQALPDQHGHFGPYGGMFVPETLMTALNELTAEY